MPPRRLKHHHLTLRRGRVERGNPAWNGKAAAPPTSAVSSRHLTRSPHRRGHRSQPVQQLRSCMHCENPSTLAKLSSERRAPLACERGGDVTFSKEFFDLQIRFACRVAELSGIALEQALLDYTNLYVRFGLGRDFDAGHPIWIDFVTGFLRSEDRAEWTYRFFLSHDHNP